MRTEWKFGKGSSVLWHSGWVQRPAGAGGLDGWARFCLAPLSELFEWFEERRGAELKTTVGSSKIESRGKKLRYRVPNTVLY